MAERNATFKCLVCGHKFEGLYDPRVAKERSCPECHSNSVRPLPEKKE